MHAIILTDTHDYNLGPLTNRVPPALLPVAGKPVVLHLLEQLHRSGIKSVSVISRNAHGVIEKATDVRPLLGMSVTFLPAIASRSLPDCNTLVIGTHQLVDINWNVELVSREKSPNGGITRLTSSSGLVIGLLRRPGTVDPVPEVWSDFSHLDKDTPSGFPKVLKLDTLNGYRAANFELLNGSCAYLFAAGRQVSSRLRAAPKAQVSTKLNVGDHAFIGSRSRIDDSAQLQGDVVIGNDVFVDRNARINNSVILDDTYIGAMTSIDDAIVTGNMLIKVDSGICLTIEDPVLLSAAV